MEESSPQSLSFSLEEEAGELHARFDPGGILSAPDIDTIRQAVLDGGWRDLYLDREALAQFVLSCRSTSQPLDQIIAMRRDGEFSLSVADDLMAAWLTLIPPQGGQPVGPAVLAALQEQGIVHGLLHSQLDAALAAGQCEHLMIARGDPPLEGTAGSFQNLFENKQEQPETADERAIIRYSDLGHLLLVHPGDPLMRRLPPVTGKNGLDIKKQVVLAKPIPELAFAANLQGAAPDPDDPDLLVATLGGQPVLLADGVMVNPVIEVPDVDLSTGNIDFEGTIRIAGDLKSGMRVKVAGDVIVNGTIEAAEIVAGGNVAVHGGIIGHADARPGSHALPANTARIRCEGSVKALFIENAHIEAGSTILIERSARQCELIAGDEIVVGKAGSGQIIGGLAQATNFVRAGVLGSNTGVKTQVQVGFDPFLDEEIARKEKLKQQKLAELDQVLKLVTFLNQNPKKSVGGMAEKAEGTRLQLLGDVYALNKELSQLGEQLESIELARVEVGKTLHYGVEIRIGAHIWQAPDDMDGTTVKLQGDTVVAGDPDE